MHKEFTYPAASAAANAAVYANECKHDATAPTTNPCTYGTNEKVCWEVMLVNLCKRSFKCTKSSHFY